MEEIWRDIYFIENGIEYDYRGLYQVSNLGNVKSLKRLDSICRSKKEKILKYGKTDNGYLFVSLSKNGKMKQFRVHRLVAYMFIPNPDNKPKIDHIIPISLGGTNHADNLRWCTDEENNNNPLTKENMSKAKRGNKHSEETKYKQSESHKGKQTALGRLVERRDKNGTLLDIKYQFEYVKMGFNSGHISSCCKGERKLHKGFIFKYHEE